MIPASISYGGECTFGNLAPTGRILCYVEVSGEDYAVRFQSQNGGKIVAVRVADSGVVVPVCDSKADLAKLTHELLSRVVSASLRDNRNASC